MRVVRQMDQFQIVAESVSELTGDELTGSQEGMPKNKVNRQEHSALNAYGNPPYRDINGHLRGHETVNARGVIVPTNHELAKQHIPHLDSLMEKVPEFTQPVLLYRGLDHRTKDTNDTEKIFGRPGEKIGKVFNDKAYISSTAHFETAQGFGKNIIHIHAGPGVKAANERITRPYGYQEGEFTFPRNSRFKVLSDEVRPTELPNTRKVVNQRHIHVKALAPHEDTDLEHFSRLI